MFFDAKGKALCAKCHTVDRKGGRVGPALDRIAARRSPEYIMESIVQPSKFIDPLFEAMQVVTKEGKVIVGLRINETNFSIQFREENGRFHSLTKRDLEEFRVMDKSHDARQHRRAIDRQAIARHFCVFDDVGVAFWLMHSEGDETMPWTNA